MLERRSAKVPRCKTNTAHVRPNHLISGLPSNFGRRINFSTGGLADANPRSGPTRRPDTGFMISHRNQLCTQAHQTFRAVSALLDAALPAKRIPNVPSRQLSSLRELCCGSVVIAIIFVVLGVLCSECVFILRTIRARPVSVSSFNVPVFSVLRLWCSNVDIKVVVGLKKYVYVSVIINSLDYNSRAEQPMDPLAFRDINSS